MGKYLQKDKFVIAISGTHGKSTTTAMLGHILEDAGFDPIVELGANDLIWGKNFRIGKSKYFICEADEYNNNFLNYKPNIVVITNIEWDHPDFFKTKDKVFQSFTKFIKNNPKLEKLCVVKNQSGINRFLISLDINHENPKFVELDDSIQKLNLRLPGIHNQINANLAKAVAISLGIEPQIIKKSLENFVGLERRFELVGKFNKIQIYQDYAHHPTELRALFDSIAEKFYKKNIWLVFQPHTYSRTIALFGDFVTVFKNSSLQKIIILPIFASRERNYKSVSSQKLASAIGNKAQYIDSFGKSANLVKDNKSKMDLLFIVGAGDIYKLTEFF
jgi:UDP-N-acetylmuramate--alanine ligase